MNTDLNINDLPEEINTEEKRNAFSEKLRRALNVIIRTEKKYLFFCFLFPALIMWIIYIAMEVYPFGNNSVLVLDLNGQYIYYFEELRELLHGNGSILYSFGRALGGEFLGIFAYYLASPFSFIVALFPKEMMTEALLVMFLLKTGLCGLTFGIYIDSARLRNRVPAVIFSTMYALTAYAVVMQHNTMWIDNLIFLPLIVLGIERLIKFGKIKLFAVSLTIALMSNFYIGYMTCIFTAVYFFYYYFSHNGVGDDGMRKTNPMNESMHFIKSLGRIIIAAVVVVSISAAILLPAYYSLSFGKNTFSDPSYDFTQKFDFLDLISKFYIGSYDTVRPEGLPFVYCGMLTLIIAPLYFISKHITLREKIASGILLAFFVISFNGSTLDLIWHGMQRPNWLNYRYSFMFTFMILVFAYKAFEKIHETNFKNIIAVCSVISLILIILQKMEYENIPDFRCVWISLGFIGVYLIALHAVMKSSLPETAMVVLTIIVCLEMFVAGILNVTSLDDDVVYSSRTSYRTFIDRVLPVTEIINERDSSFFRMEKTVHRKTNDNLALGIRGLSNSTSTLNASTIKLLNNLGLSSKSHWSKYLGGTPVLDSLLGIKYLISEKNSVVFPLYDKMFTYNNDLTVYQNPYSLPIAYGVNSEVKDIDFSEVASPMYRMNRLVSAMLKGTDETEEIINEMFIPINIDNTGYENCETSYTTGHKKYYPTVKGKTTKIIFTIHAPKDGLIYCYFPSDYQREVSLTLNGSDFDTYFGNETYRILCLGEYKKGEEITLSMKLEKDDLYIASEASYFYCIDEAAFAENMTALAECGFEIEQYTEDSFKGNISVKDGRNLIFTTIPYDKGWIVKVDGEKTETVKVLDSLMAFEASSGEHSVTIEYRPDAVKYGLLISAWGIIMFILLAIAWQPLKIKEKITIIYEPEEI